MLVLITNKIIDGETENILLYEYLLYEHPPDWDLRCKIVKERDFNKCCNCGGNDDLNVHHKIPITESGTHFLDNLITLCNNCHLDYHPEIKEKIRENEKQKRITICPVHNVSMKRFVIFSFLLKHMPLEDLRLKEKYDIICTGNEEYEGQKYGYIRPECINIYGRDYEESNDDNVDWDNNVGIYLLNRGDKYINQKHVYLVYNGKLFSLDEYFDCGNIALID